MDSILSDNPQLIVVIGLPGSGKTTFCRYMEKEHGYIVFDDFISDYFSKSGLSGNLDKEKICVCDPRLCMKGMFDYYMGLIQRFINKDKIKLILFDNNPEQCLINIQLRNDKLSASNNVGTLSQHYCIENYEGYNGIILPVYLPTI